MGDLDKTFSVLPGVIQSLDWDEAVDCGGKDCTLDMCIDNACGIAVPLNGADGCGYACTVKLYLTWVGTDAGGRSLISASASPVLFCFL